ncbi:MAG: hypothetical protein LC660_17730 [Desulfobacteraceae bacterium]|nr:hypothetical protein [Desulfobacteraceae bacterium]
MKSIASNLPAPTALSGGKNLSQAKVFHQERFLNMVEKLEAGVTIKTREGDVVRLSAGTFAQFASSEYNSRGIIRAEDSIVQQNYHQRTISLHTKESFSFSVQGDLNEQELADIDAIIQGIDGIIGQMAAGNMEEAVSQAMGMDTFDSISMYAADISLEQRYAYQETIESGVKTDMPAASDRSRMHDTPFARNVASFTDKMAKFLEKQQDLPVAKAAPGLDALFRHHQKHLPETKSPEGSLSLALENARKQMDQLIAQMMKDSFGDQLDQTA